MAVKPHASPVLHAIKYLLGASTRRTSRRCANSAACRPTRAARRTPTRSTSRPARSASASSRRSSRRRRVATSTRTSARRRTSRFIALLGDAELDEGNVWEAITDPSTAGLGNVLWVVDLNRQSLDRVIPGIKAERLERMFEDNGWHVVEAKYGRRLQAAFAAPGRRGPPRTTSTTMSNEEYQALFAHPAPSCAPGSSRTPSPTVAEAIAGIADDDLASVVQNLGGHDLAELVAAFTAVRRGDRPAERRVRLHDQGLGPADRRRPDEPLGVADRRTDRRVPRRDRSRRATPSGTASTPRQPRRAAGDTRRASRPSARRATSRNRRSPSPPKRRLGRDRQADVDPGGVRSHPGRPRRATTRSAARLVTTSPDVSVTTNLGGWINRIGVFTPRGGTRLARRRPAAQVAPVPSGQHIELGISEMNLFMLLSQLGLVVRPVRRAAPADRRALRPVRVPWTGRPDLRRVLRRAVRRRRHAVGRHARAGGRRPPVDDHRVDRRRAARPRRSAEPAYATARRLAPVRRPGARRRPRRAGRLALPASHHPADRPGAVRGGRAPGWATTSYGARCWPAATASSTPPTAAAGGRQPVVNLCASGAVMPEVRRRRRASSPTRA